MEDPASQIGRLNYLLGCANRDRDKLYEHARKLENLLRDHAHNHRCGVDGHCADLLRHVPKHARPTLREKRRGKR